jgi:hypothetical protein
VFNHENSGRADKNRWEIKSLLNITQSLTIRARGAREWYSNIQICQDKGVWELHPHAGVEPLHPVLK